MRRVLIIDDEKSICKLLSRALSNRGIETDVAENGQEGLEKYHQEYFDIVVTDVRMPGIDGNSVAHQIRNSNRPKTPIIGITGTSWLADNGEFDLVFEKPMSIHSFVDTIINIPPAL